MRFLLTLIIAISVISCTKEEIYTFYEATEVHMGTIVKIKVFVDKDEILKSDFDRISGEAFKKIAELEKQMSEYKKDSPISLLAKNAGIAKIEVTPDILKVAEIALEISKETDGAFDVTFKPLGWLWNVKKRTTPPRKSEILRAKALVGYKNLLLNKKKRTLFLKKKGMHVGLGGLAKGYAAKKAGEVLKSNGIENFIINAGGDLYVEGKKREGLTEDSKIEYWTSGIRDPSGKPKLVVRFKIINGGAVVTSGDYERFFDYKGVRYHHIIDLRTGYPARGIKSITVISKDPTYADAYATSFFVIGYEESLKIVKKREDVAFVMIDENNKVLKSPNIEKFVEFF